MASDGTGTVTISAEDWHAFLQQYLPFRGAAEYVLSEPKYDEEGNIEFKYAFSDFCHPSAWVEPPKWLKEQTE